MSFHKRRLEKDIILKIYEDGGLSSLENYVTKADSLIATDKLGYHVLDAILDLELTLPQKWDKIYQLIIKEKNGRKRTTI